MTKPTKSSTETFAELQGVEILRTGTHNGVEITDEMLEQMAGSFGKVGFHPALKLDEGKGRKTHSDGGPAYGWVAAVRREGSKLIADFRDVVDSLIPYIQRKQYDRVSAEVFPAFERAGKKFGAVLKAVELMGASVPAVPDLKPVSESLGFSAEVSGQEAIAVECDFSEEAEMPEQENTKELEALQAKLAEAEAKIAKFEEESRETVSFQETDEYKAMAQQIEALKQEQRQTWRNGVVADCKIPALRRHVALFADLAATHKGEEVFKFSEKDEDGKDVVREVKPREAVESFVRDVNANAEILFRDTAVDTYVRPEGTEENEPDSPTAAAEFVDEKVREFQEKNPGKGYAEALEAVMPTLDAKIIELWGK